SLEKKHLKDIVSLMSDQLTKRLKEQDLSIELTEAAKEKIADEGVDLEYGARPLRRAIQKHVEDRLSEELLKGHIQKGQHIVLDVEDGEFVVKTESKTN
ncbi:ATP-dependent Clp protease ATP-binding subunit, partial [Bacillus subtilis]